MNKKEAIQQLKAKRQLSAAMLKPLNISIEIFLRYAELPDDRASEVVTKLIEKIDQGKW